MKNIVTSALVIFIMTAGLGIGYPLAVWAIAQSVFPYQANGSLIAVDGVVVGSELIGQKFDAPGYFRSRLSAAGSGYDAAASGGSNLGPTSKKLIARISSDAAAIGADNPGVLIPADLVTTSASGLDPDITPAAAEFQVRRVAAERGVAVDVIRRIVEASTQGRQLGFLGEPRVNVLRLNLELDRRFGPSGK